QSLQRPPFPSCTISSQFSFTRPVDAVRHRPTYRLRPRDTHDTEPTFARNTHGLILVTPEFWSPGTNDMIRTAIALAAVAALAIAYVTGPADSAATRACGGA